MPGLLRGMARTAVVAGTATAVSNRVSRRQAQRWGYMDEPQQQGYDQPPPQQQYAPPPPAPAAPSDDPIDRLNELAQLRDRGILTDEEFAAAKAKVLNG
jgi:hypothetical protein